MIKIKTALVTINIGDLKYSKFSIPLMKNYAEKIGADFIEITERSISYRTPHWEKWQIGKILDDYDYVLYVDADLLISPNTPNLFDNFKEPYFGAVYEDIGKELKSRRRVIQQIQYYKKNLGWKEGYFNTGVMIIPSSAKEVFLKLKDFNGYNDIWYDQTAINYLLTLLKIPMQELGIEWNYVECFQDMGMPVDEIYIYHYAGGGVDRHVGRDRFKQMKYRYGVMTNEN